MGLPLVLVLAQVSAGAVDRVDLSAAASSGPRPDRCRATARPAGTGLWDHARDPGLTRFCFALARGYAALDKAPRGALAAAAEAARALPEHPAPRVLEGRARVSLGQFAAAHQLFEAARTKNPSSVQAPGALHAAALAAAHTGHLTDAARYYRALVPRAALLDDAWQRQRVYIEAAMVAMTQGPDALDEAIGYLTEARRRGSPPGLGDYVAGALALALDRQGRREEAAGVAAAASGPWRLERVANPDPEPQAVRRREQAPFLPAGEVHALVAILAARHDAELCRDSWEAFIEERGDAPFVDHARARMEER